jgi:hypothetical protein
MVLIQKINEDVIVVDDIIPLSFQEEIKHLLLGSNFNWHYVTDVTNGSLKKQHNQNRPAFSHKFVDRNKGAVCQYTSLVAPLSHFGADIAQKTLVGIYQSRSFLQVPLNPSLLSEEADSLHLDLLIPHLVVLYYVVTSTGDTIIIDKKYDPSEGEIVDLKEKDFKTIARVTPKQGRALIFNGAYYHTAEQPTGLDSRCIINIDVAIS